MAFSVRLRTSSSAAFTPTAFTLVELLIVVAIIAILAAIAVPNFLDPRWGNISRTHQRTEGIEPSS